MNENRSSLAVPIAIIVCILIIIGAFYYQSQNPGKPASNQTASSTVPAELSQILPPAENIDMAKFRSVDATDKIRGSANAPIKLVVYTDLECPACKYFHTQLKTLEGRYVPEGTVAIIYRDFPLDSLHSKSRTESLAAECVNETGGLEKYWQFVDKIFEITPSNNGLDLAKLGETAKALGIDTKTFDACVASKKYADKIQKSVDEALALGAQGTPFFVLVTPNQNIPVFGGIPADRLAAAFDLLLGKTSDSPASASTTAQ
ncbi:MAG: thioredoxin domain-containing protein [Candidatus Paceibacterota bacterium]|jgi:protein-disulfide isomerase